MRLCSMCGGVVPETSAFCQGCGARYEGAEVAVPNQPSYQSQAGAFSQGETRQGTAPMNQLKTNRSLIKLILLSIVTLGIYAIIFFYRVSEDINTIASRYDGKRTMNYLLILFIIGPITLGIAAYVWFHRFSNRVGSELNRREINYNFNAGTYWMFYGIPSIIYGVAYVIWFVTFFSAFMLGLVTFSPIIGILGLVYLVLMCVYFHKLCEAFNLLSEHYNVNG